MGLACVLAAAIGSGSPLAASHHGRHLRLLFDRHVGKESGKDYEIFSIKPGGADQQNLTNKKTDDWGPQASRDGRRIVFVSERDQDGNDEVLTMKPDGSQVRQLTHQPGGTYSEYPHFSPNGKKIVFDTNAGGDNGEIWVMDSDGSHKHSLHRAGYGPAFSPNGKRIAFTSLPSGSDSEVAVMRPNGSHLKVLTDNEDTSDEGVSWFPNSKRLAFDRNDGSDDEIWTISARGKHPKRLTKNSANDYSAAVSPSGKKMAFVSSRGGESGIFVMHSDGSHAHPVTPGKRFEEYPSWALLRP